MAGKKGGQMPGKRGQPGKTRAKKGLPRPTQKARTPATFRHRNAGAGGRRGREAEGGGLLNRYTVKSRIEGSNPSVSANVMQQYLAGRRYSSTL